MLKLKLQYFGHHMRRVDSFEKTLMLVGIGGRRRYNLYPLGVFSVVRRSLLLNNTRAKKHQSTVLRELPGGASREGD